MAVRIRLTRVGATKQPSYRVVVADSRSARDSRSIETLGHYNPRSEPIELNIDADKAKAWMAKGALPSDTVARLFRSAGVMPRDPVIDARNAARSKAASEAKAAKAKAAAAEKPAPEKPVASAPVEASAPGEAAAPAEEAAPTEAVATAEPEAVDAAAEANDDADMTAPAATDQEDAK
jgi:small subunit ribosomal protein S16